MGYFMTTAMPHRNVCRITAVYNKSVAMKCYVPGHTGCSTSLAEWKLPSVDAIKNWAVSAKPAPPTATPADKKAAVAEHRAAMQLLMNAAVWPGRTRQGLIDAALGSHPA